MINLHSRNPLQQQHHHQKPLLHQLMVVGLLNGLLINIVMMRTTMLGVTLMVGPAATIKALDGTTIAQPVHV